MNSFPFDPLELKMENGKRKTNLFILVTKRIRALGKAFPRDNRMSFTVP